MASISREQELQDIHKRYKDFYQISGGILFVIIGIWIGSLMFQDGYATNLYTELLSVTVTILVLDRLNDYRARLRDRELLKQRLIREAGSKGHAVAVTALDWIRAEAWLDLLKGANLERTNWEGAYVGNLDLTGANLETANLTNVTTQIKEGNTNKNYPMILEKANLRSANLQEADLREANLQQAFLYEANLQEADLREANLQQAFLWYANLQQARLWETNLQQARLWEANLQQAHLWRTNLQEADLKDTNLQEANLSNANLQEANLSNANLQAANLLYTNLRGANLEDTKFNEQTILPDAKTLKDEDSNNMKDEDGELIFDKHWTPETDMSRYTDPNHPDFWEQPYLKSDYEPSEFDDPQWVKDWHENKKWDAE